ncbi:glycoprotein-N-acetylgalactosamine 3-beta-galactosyltransferase 1-like [Wyeomyia smithii]|uniref:glycoprotein-N-acetylgalactosamine 3-beta-galactosyltransferase 1-like n=1 Tax=Wyeomyia smithii TaxID=174621 RepID=UPI00246813D2|nr:glycoprotein-N-acetylgalactosamine 3-beta-galactosyltransferase 1-like [Wyeomyia smithii]XP_055530709.1 glycoprotein-N-acetylgalactosamine 3-beta-galactosyltransferase 1-like [Wyeomyia smithii]
MSAAQLSLFQRKTSISRRQLTFLTGITVACLFTVVSLLQQKRNDLPEPYRSGFADDHQPTVSLTDSVRILCWVMTSPANHDTRAIHVKQTWGSRCNKLLIMSSAEDEKLGTVVLKVTEGRRSLWNKTRESFRYVYENHLNEYDWFLKADDDTYVIVENLRYFLYSYSSEYPIYFGSKFRFPQYVSQGYFSGGAGYVLSREALKRFIEQALDKAENCSVVLETEDLEMGKCMESINVTAGDSRDHLGRKRFLPLEPKFHLTSNPVDDPDFWYNYYSFYEPFYGLKCCSDLAISFHYVQGPQMHVMDFLIYGLHPYGLVYKNPPLPPKKSWDEAKAVAGPYPARSTTVRTTSSSESSTAVDVTEKNENGVSENASEALNFSESATEAEFVSKSSSFADTDGMNLDDFANRIVNDKILMQKIMEKLQSQQNAA